MPRMSSTIILHYMRKRQVTSAIRPVETAENLATAKKDFKSESAASRIRRCRQDDLLCRERRHWQQHVFLAHDEIGGVQRGQLEAVAMSNCVSRTGLDAIAAENAAVVVDVVDLGITLR